MIIILFGAPGVGKGTIAQQLQAQGLGKQVSTGDLFRKEISLNSEVSKVARKYIDVGQLVPDDITLKIVENEIANGGNLLLDGYPRTVKQVKDLDTLLASQGKKIDVVVNVVASGQVVIDRLVNRVVCVKCHAIYNKKYSPPKTSDVCDKCGEPVIHRSDDDENTIKTRYQEYLTKTKPLLDTYKTRGLVVEVNSEDAGVIDKIKHLLQKS